MTLVVMAVGDVVASLRSMLQGQKEEYLLWELGVVESGLKDAGRKDWKMDKETP